MSIDAPTPPTVTVCDACLCASCWQGAFYCEGAATAGTREMTRDALRTLARESPHYWEETSMHTAPTDRESASLNANIHTQLADVSRGITALAKERNALAKERNALAARIAELEADLAKALRGLDRADVIVERSERARQDAVDDAAADRRDARGPR
jgi:chromosome segregation ATPase